MQDGAVVLDVRTLESAGDTVVNHPLPSFGTMSIRSRLGLLGRYAPHDESNQTFQFCNHAVCVREKIRVESQDPSLMAVLAKLSALAHSVAAWQLKLRQVLNQTDE